MISVLAKDLKFAMVINKIPKEEIISQIEPSIYRLPSEQADNLYINIHYPSQSQAITMKHHQTGTICSPRSE